MNLVCEVRKCLKPAVEVGLWMALVVAASAQAKDGLPSPAEEHHIAVECAPFFDVGSTRHALHMAKVRVQSQGMRLVVQACPFVRIGPTQMQQVLDVRVVVADSETASYFVRGPLADGEVVDMGDVHLARPVSAAVAPLEEEDVSPDVQFNRSWLASVMQGRGWAAVPAHWWAFVPVDPDR